MPTRSLNENTTINLDETQSALIDIVEGKHYLQAPPGAGKTAVLTQRLKHGIDKFTLQDIACLTFTTRAADEMKARANMLLVSEDKYYKGPFIGNFHGFCIHHLHISKTIPKHQKYFALLNEDFRIPLLKQAMQRAQEADLNEVNPVWLALCAKSSQNYTSRSYQATQFGSAFMEIYIHMLALDIAPNKEMETLAKQELCKKLELFLQVAKSSLSPLIDSIEELAAITWSIYRVFRQLKTATNSLDFDDILIIALADLIQYPNIKMFIQVDEVQDLSLYQWAIVDAITNKQSHIFAVGDEQQSIYSFMGADLTLLQARTQGFTPHYLVNNYRSHPNIITLLNAYRQSNWQAPAIKAESAFNNPENQEVASILLGFDNPFAETQGVRKAVAKILQDKSRSVGVLLSTNKACDEYFNALQGVTTGVFRVSQNDLMHRPIIQDWFSLLRIFSANYSYHDWWRLVYRIGLLTDPQLTKETTIAFCSQLQTLGFSIQDILPTSYSDEGDIARIIKLHQAYLNKGVVIFDTETTGLDFEKAHIVQLAAVRVINGEVVDTFDKYVKLDLNSDIATREAFEASQIIHNITEAELESGNCLEEVISGFFDFVGESPVVAHNLMFDHTMLRMNIERGCDSALKDRYISLYNNGFFDSLALARQLYPNQPSHKLGDLLAAFNLPGVNSHNALDDVKATASLLSHLLKQFEQKFTHLADLLARYKKMTNALHSVMPKLLHQMREVIEESGHIQLSHTLEKYMSFAVEQKLYEGAQLSSTGKEIEDKLIPWLNKNGFSGLFNYILDSRREETEKLLTLKESDLIDKSIHRLVISTVHRAKGLEFETVILPQVTDNNYPMWMPDHIPEHERQARTNESCRLLYVGLSRPRNKLVMTYHTRSGNFPRSLSPFVSEIVGNFAMVKTDIG